MNTTTATGLKNPFPGLRPFREEEAHLFFGRESQVDTMIDKLAKTRFLAVVGTSGSGKSSLVNCGLCPALHRGLMCKAGTAWRVVQFRPGGNTLRNMAHALATPGLLFGELGPGGVTRADMIEATLAMSSLGLVEVYKLAHLDTGVNLLVVADQFEELFRYQGVGDCAVCGGQVRSQQAVAFVNLLLKAKAQADFPIYIVMSMRSEYLAGCADFPGLAEAINEGEYLVPRMTREERRAAIAGPISVGGGTISPVLLTRLVNDAGDNPDQLSILQHALNRTWARWQHQGQGEGSLDLPHYEAIGTMAHALDQHAEKAFGELKDDRRKKICEKIFRALTDKWSNPEGVRRYADVATLCALSGASPEEVTQVIDVFRKPSRSFLMPPLPEELTKEKLIYISHESLMRVWERLKGWAEQELQSVRLYRRLSEWAALHPPGSKKGLWEDPDLQLALDWRDREKPTMAWAELYGGGFDLAMRFLAESEARRQEKVREKEERQKLELRQAQALAEERRLRAEEQAERQKLELEQVQALSEERRQRAEEQAEAARRLRWQVRALFVVGVLLAAVVVYALLTRAKAIQARNVAEQQREAAQKSDHEMRLEALRVRDQNLIRWSDLVSLADELLKYSSPQQSARWRFWKAEGLMQQGDYESAEPLFSAACENSPDNPEVRTSRGYVRLLLNRPKDALKDFEYIRDHIDPLSYLNHLNLAVTYAELENYAAASESIEKAKANVRYTSSPGGIEALIPPEITSATGRTTLTTNKESFEAALYYMAANLKAYVGDLDGFQAALSLADKKAERLPALARKDAYFSAMTWAWLHLRNRCPDSGACKDYGALASEAKLWEKAGYPDWAACSYQQFQEKDKLWPDQRYKSLAKWVGQSKLKLGLPSSFSCDSLKRKPDAPTLEIEAREAQAKRQYSIANNLLDKALSLPNDSERVPLLLRQADALSAFGWSEAQSVWFGSKILVPLYEDEINNLKNKKKAEEAGVRKLADRKDPSALALALRGLDKKYAPKIADVLSKLDKAEADEKRHEQLARDAFLRLEDDSKQILQRDPKASVAYFYLALSHYGMLDRDHASETSMETIVRDLRRALELEPAYTDALQLLDDLAPDSKSNKDVAYLERNQDVLAAYYRSSPYNKKAFVHQARLANKQKHYAEALQSIDAAIAIEPEDLSLYDIRAEAERGLGIDESQVQRDLAEVHRQAGDFLKRRGDVSGADDAYQKSWAILAKLAKDHENEEVRCDPSLTTCNITKTVEQNSEWIFSGILSVGNVRGNEGVARIDKGRDDGVVVGAQGDLWSVDSQGKAGHKRAIMKLGTGKVLSVEPDSALIHIKMDSPSGDGMVRARDCLQLRARTPLHPQGSHLWALAKYDVTVEDVSGNKIMNYRTVYSGDTSELEDRVIRIMLDDVHASGQVQGSAFDELLGGKPISKGIYEGKNSRQALESASLDGVRKSLDYAAKYPGEFFGRNWSTSVIYMTWVVAGTPSD
jgi:energy-coupling factor transporter ATP-binding protein EcfA2